MADTGAKAAAPALRSCPLCGSNDLRPWRPGEPLVLQCHSCGSGWVAAPPPQDVIDSLYQEAYYQEGTGARFMGFAEWALVALKKLRYRAIAARVPGPGTILDVGCGRGDLLLVFHDQGWRVLGTQLSRTAAEAARKTWGLDVLVGDLPALELPRASFDVITFFHVLEHLPDPALHLREAFACLKDKGLLVVEVPNFRTLGFGFLGRRHLCYDSPHHLIFFSPRGLKALLAACGFREESRSFFSLEYGPFTLLQNWLNVLPGEPNRLYRALKGDPTGRSLRIHPLTWIHIGLGILLSLPALLFSLTGLCFPVGNTLRVYCRKATI